LPESALFGPILTAFARMAAASAGRSIKGGQPKGSFDGIESYCADRGGSRPLKRILIANNGIGAVKAIRSIRKWAYDMFGNEREVRSPSIHLDRMRAHFLPQCEGAGDAASW